ncbi:MAG: type VI secretion system baseplate subunit TssF [Planctomycetaceae bacterium]
MSEELLPWYNRELAFIRQAGNDFARSYPKIAGKLRLNGSASDDPHVERLIESFAFLTARVRKKLEDDLPNISEAMLETLHPNYLAPIPPLTVTQLSLDSSAGKLTTSYEVPRHSNLESETDEGFACRFRTCYPVTLWPLRLTRAELNGPPFQVPPVASFGDSKSVLRISFESLNKDLPIGSLGLNELRLFLSGQKHDVHELYELLFNNVRQIIVAKDSGDPSPRVLPASALRQVGFEQGQELLPHSARTPKVYQLLREYFAFPAKFHFVDIAGLDEVLSGMEGTGFSLFFQLDRRVESLERFVSRDAFRLGCTPVVNLFEQSAEPIRLTHEQSEYQVVPDARHPQGNEVFAITSVTAVDSDGVATEVPPMYSSRHSETIGGNSRFWTATRKPARFSEDVRDAGTDMFLSVVDLDLSPADRAEYVLQIETTSLNRDMVSQLPFGGGKPEMRLEKPGPVGNIECLLHPTPTRRPPLGDGVLWRLISQLSLNHLSITDGESGAETLRETLRVYDFVRETAEPFPFDGITDIQSRRTVTRVATRDEAGFVESAFARGVEVGLELDEERFVGTGMFLFASVMERFLALHCSLNSFSQLVLRTRQRKELKTWKPRSGYRVLS